MENPEGIKNWLDDYCFCYVPTRFQCDVRKGIKDFASKLKEELKDRSSNRHSAFTGATRYVDFKDIEETIEKLTGVK